MNPVLSDSFHFADFRGFSALRRAAADDTPEARRAVAQQFEAMFLNQLISQMRQAGAVEGGLFDSPGTTPYQSMHDQQLALNLAQGRGIGLADAILRQFGDAPGARSAADAARLHRDIPVAPVAGVAPGAAAARGERFRPDSPERFVDAVWPHAQRAAARLGVEPEVLVAQAALETGWGRSQIEYPDGRSTFNLFGIKATGSWRGARVTVPTLEFVDGIAERRREQFRAYPDLEQGFSDYVRLVAAQPRYRAALEAGSGEGYLRGLQSGGYATDPDYADKILAIVRRGLPGRSYQEIAAAADTGRSSATPERHPGTEL